MKNEKEELEKICSEIVNAIIKPLLPEISELIIRVLVYGETINDIDNEFEKIFYKNLGKE